MPASCHVLCKCRNKNIDAHGFSDNLGEAYAGCIYILSNCYHGVMVTLIVNKCPLVPSKSQNIPRLELLYFLPLSKLVVSLLDLII